MLEQRVVVMDLYGPLLAKALFPAFEAARGRPTVPLLRYLRDDRALVARSAARSAGRPAAPAASPRVPPHRVLPRSDRRARPAARRHRVRRRLCSACRCSIATPCARRWTRDSPARRRASAIKKSTSGTTGEPVVVKYNAESRHWRDATRWRGYGWGGYRIGMRALHYWGFGPPPNELVPAPQGRARSHVQARPLRRLHAARRRSAAARGQRSCEASSRK